MAISSFSDDVNVIAALGDNPNTDNSLSADQLKAKFDYAANLIKTYINSTLVGAINTIITNIGTLSSGKADVATTLAGYGITDAMTATAINSALGAKQDTITANDYTAAAADWSGNENTVSVSGLQATDIIVVSPAPSSFYDWRDNGVYCKSQSAGNITLGCETEPSGDLTVNVMVVG